MKSVRPQGSLETIVMDIFCHNIGRNLIWRNVRPSKSHNFSFDQWNFDRPYSITISVRRPNFRCKCCKIQSEIQSGKGQFSIVVVSMLFSTHFSRPVVTPLFYKFPFVNYFCSSIKFWTMTESNILINLKFQFILNWGCNRTEKVG